jgi:hypothetical protein
MRLILFFLMFFSSAIAIGQVTWGQQLSRAVALGVGANGTTWILKQSVDGKPSAGGYRVAYLNTGGTWIEVPGAGMRIAVEPDGNPWIVNDSKAIYRWDGAKFVLMPGTAYDIGIGANGVVWVIGTNPLSGGYDIFKWNGKGWANVPGGAGVRIAVDPRGNAWVVNDKRAIYRWDGTRWVGAGGSAQAIGIASNGKVWVIGTNPVEGGYGVHYLGPNGGWISVPGGLIDIAVGPDGHAWGINSRNEIFKMGAPNRVELSNQSQQSDGASGWSYNIPCSSFKDPAERERLRGFICH